MFLSAIQHVRNEEKRREKKSNISCVHRSFLFIDRDRVSLSIFRSLSNYVSIQRQLLLNFRVSVLHAEIVLTLTRKLLYLYLNNLGSVWVDERISSIDATLKIMQEKLSATEKDFEELLFRRKTTIQYSSQNDATLNQILNLIDPSDKGDPLMN